MKVTAEMIEGFAGSLLSGRYDEAASTPEAHLEWWTLCCSDAKRVAIAAPRGHAKSTAITKAYVLAVTLFRERRNVYIISDTYGQAVQFLGEIKTELLTNEDLIKLFKIKELSKDREDQIIVEFDDGYKFRIVAIGSEQKIRGTIWDGTRPDLIVGDDLENDEIVMNDDRREKFRTWFLNAVIPALSERGVIRLVGTILHMDALLERLMPKDRDPDTVHEALKSYTTKTVGGWMSIRYAAHTEDFSEILWPSKWTKKRFLDLQELFHRQGNMEGYYQEYLNRPIDPQNAYFRKDDFLEMHDNELKLTHQDFLHYIGCDLALSTDTRRDYSAFVIGGMDQFGMLHIRKVIKRRLDALESVKLLFELNDIYHPDLIIIEKGQIDRAITPFLNQAMMQTGKFLPFYRVPTNTTDKRARARSIQARMRAGGVKFNKKADWYSDLESEMLRFDRDIHDDQVDAMAMLGLGLAYMKDALTPKEQEQNEWDEENRPFIDEYMNQGRSLITGY